MCLVKHHNAEGMRDAGPGEDGVVCVWGGFSRDAGLSLTVIVGKNHLDPERQTHSHLLFIHTPLEGTYYTSDTVLSTW